MDFARNGRDRAFKKRLLENHVAPAVLAEIARRPVILESGALARTLTFLVCRLRGFEDIVTFFAKDPEGLARYHRRIMTPLAQAILDHRGTIQHIAPGELAAFFNAPLSDPRHAVHACECALALQNSVESVNLELERGVPGGARPIPPAAIGIGLATGEGIVGDFGTGAWPHFAATGRAGVQAGAIERLSKLYDVAIVAAQSTVAFAEQHLPFLEVDTVAEGEERFALFALAGPAPSRANPKFLALKTFHDRIFAALRVQAFEKARTLIGQCRALSDANPTLYDFYLERIARLEAKDGPANARGFTVALNQ